MYKCFGFGQLVQLCVPGISIANTLCLQVALQHNYHANILFALLECYYGMEQTATINNMKHVVEDESHLCFTCSIVARCF